MLMSDLSSDVCSSDLRRLSDVARALDGIRIAVIHFDGGAVDHAFGDVAIIARDRDITSLEVIFEGRVVALRFLRLEIGVARAATALDQRVVRLIERDRGVERAEIRPAQRFGIAEADLDTVADLETRGRVGQPVRSEEHTSELQSLMRTSYAVFCL